MNDVKKSKVLDLRKNLKPGKKLEQLVLDYAVRKTAGCREDLHGVFYSKNGRHVVMASKSLSGRYAVCEGTREIDGDAFWGCAYLEEIQLPEGLEVIGHEAFGRCISLRRLELPSTIRKIGANPFVGLGNICVESRSKEIVYDGKTVYSEGGKCLVSFLSDDSVFVVPEGVEEIGDKAFFGKKNLRWITLPKSLKIIGDQAFFDCDSLRIVIIPEHVEAIGACAFGDSEMLRDVEFEGVPDKIKRSMLAGCDNIHSITVPAGRIGNFKKLVKDFDDRVEERPSKNGATAEKKDELEKSAKSEKKGKKNKKGENTSAAAKRISPMYKK